MLDTVTRPDGSILDVTPDAAGRASSGQLPSGTLNYGYYDVAEEELVRRLER